MNRKALEVGSERRKVTGLSLIELMVSILLGIILSAGIIAVYLESKRNYDAEEALARIQENGRFAISLLKRELSLAGFYGGYFVADDTPAVSVTNDCVSGANWALRASPAIEVIDDFGSPPSGFGQYETKANNVLNNCGLDEAKAGTDIVVVKRSAGEATIFNSLPGADAVTANQWYLRTQGFGEVKEWELSTGTATLDPNTTEYWEVYTKIFFVQDESVAVGGVPTLCVKELTGTGMNQPARCLVEGIEDLQIEFGVDTDGDGTPNIYTPDPNDMEVATTARIYILARSIGELFSTENDNTKIYQLGLNSGSTTMNDGYLRQIFSTTVLVRNAVLPVTN